MDAQSTGLIFAPLLGIISAVVATTGSILMTVFGPLKRLRLPVESVPGMSRGFLNVVLFAPFVACFLSIDPGTAKIGMIAAVIALVLGVYCYQAFGALMGLHRYVKPMPGKLFKRRIREEIICGGDQLTPAATLRQSQTGRMPQELLADAGYNPDEIWLRPGRVAVQTRIERWYYSFMLCTLLTVVLAALVLETDLTGRAPLTDAKKAFAALSK